MIGETSKMKKLKKILIVFLLVFLLTGCTKQLVVENELNGYDTTALINDSNLFHNSSPFIKCIISHNTGCNFREK